MKKLGIGIIILIIFLIIYILQANFFSFFTIAGIKPNLFILLVLVIGLYAGKISGIAFGVIFGMILDFSVNKYIGISSIMLGIVGFLGGYFDKNFSKESRITVILMIIGSTVLCETGTYLWNILKAQGEIEIFQFVRILSIETLYNSILTIILYPIIQKCGYRLEENYKEQKILTRYF